MNNITNDKKNIPIKKMKSMVWRPITCMPMEYHFFRLVLNSHIL